MNFDDRQEQLEALIKQATDQRELTRTKINQVQGDLNSLFTKNPKKPRESLPEVQKKINELEHERTIVSMPLQEEKKILKQIHTLEKTKREVEEHIEYEKKVQLTKDQLTELRSSVKVLNDEIGELLGSLAKEKLAKKAGCSAEELEKYEMSCPPEKVGSIIGKSGTNIKRIEDKCKVSLDIDSIGGAIRIYGDQESIDMAKNEIDKVVKSVDVEIQVAPELVTYLATKFISAVTKLREEHPDVYFDVSKRNKDKVNFRGHPDDIENLKRDMLAFDIICKERRVTSQEAIILIGRKGATIEQIVEKHKAAIDVEKEDDDFSVAKVSGPPSNVDAAMLEIEQLVDANKEVIEVLPVAQIVRQTLLLESGIKIKQLQAKVNESCGTGVSLSFDNKTINNEMASLVVKTKNSVMISVVEMVKEKLQKIEESTVHVSFDPFIIPLIIGKGGETIRSLQEGKLVAVEIDRKNNRIGINGLENDDVMSVRSSIIEIIEENKVERVKCDESSVETQYRELLRSKERNAIRELNVRLDIDKDKSEIVLRGKGEELTKALGALNEFLRKNFIEEVPISNEDKDVLVSGGANSMVVKFSKELGVNLSVDRTRFVLAVRGISDKVESAVKAINAFLHGGDGNSVSRISVTQESLGYVIGKGGKKRAALEAKYTGVSIHIHGSNRITLRGPEDLVKDCRIEILKIVASARIYRTVEINRDQNEKLISTNTVRRITQSIPVQISLKDESVEVRGFSSDVRDAISLINEQINGVYKTCVELDASHLGRVRGACRDPSHFERMKISTGAEVKLDLAAGSIMINGKRANVKKAKLQVMGFLQFLLPATFGVVNLSKPLHSTVGQGSSLADVAAVTGASLYLDRDISSIILQSFGKGKVEDASKLLKSKIQEAEKLVYYVQFEPDEAWLIPLIIGRNGNLINSIRKQSQCNIDVSKEERSVVVTGTDEDNVSIAKTSIDNLVDKARRETLFIDIPELAMPTFVGRSGAHIAEFSRTHGVDIQVMRKGPSKVRVQGEEEQVLAAKKAITAWLSGWEQSVAASKVQLQNDNQIPAVIGRKGATIRALEEEFGCKVEIDRPALQLIIRGSTLENREACIEKINTLIQPKENNGGRSESRNGSDYASGNEGSGRPKQQQSGPSGNTPDKPGVGSEERPDRRGEYPSKPVGVMNEKEYKKKMKSLVSNSSYPLKGRDDVNGNDMHVELTGVADASGELQEETTKTAIAAF